MKKTINIIVLLCLFILVKGNAQCGDLGVCNSNTGLYSNNDAGSIAYDNMGSGFHSTFIREPNGSWRVWGECMQNNGSSNVLSPVNFNTTNYPALTGIIYKMGIGSSGMSIMQFIVLTSTGLFALGSEGVVIDGSLTSSRTFQKIVVNGKSDGLPIGISPEDVRMMFVTFRSIIITTCSGEVHVLTLNSSMRGNGGVSPSTIWSKVMINSTQPLNNIIVARGNSSVGFALASDGSLWTWGANTYLGDGSGRATRNYATQMVLPAGLSGIKTIQATYTDSYYILSTDKKVYSLGGNQYGQLGDRTTQERKVWVNAKNPDNSVITNAAWISANEHDPTYPGLAVINENGKIYTAGNNSAYMIGRTVYGGTNYLDIPNGIVASDVITYAEVGGHTCALIKLGSPRYGYVGHSVSGSMGNGSSTGSEESSYDFITPPIVAVCGTPCAQPVLTSNTPICPGMDAIFTLTGTPGDIISYKINGGSVQDVVIGTNGSVNVTIPSPISPQTISLVYVLGGTGSCSNYLSTVSTVTMSSNVVPIFEPQTAICQGESLNPLPTTSQNGITGTWSPALNNMATTIYTFTPSGSVSCASSVSMTITVIPIGSVPTFTQIPDICEGASAPTLPTVSQEGIIGTWSPVFNNLTTTTYTFTPITTTCLAPAQMTIVIIPKTTPQFTPVSSICKGGVLNPLPTTSINNFSGVWAPNVMNNQQTTTYFFTPNAGVCANGTSMTITVNPIIAPSFTQGVPICEGEVMTPLPTTSLNNITGTWAPNANNTTTTTYIFTPEASACANQANMTIVVKQKVTPTFTPINIQCYGVPLFALPTVSNNLIGITGTWNPTVINNTQTTTYYFTPASSECAYTTQMQVGVYPDFDFNYDGYCRNGEYFLEITPKDNSFAMNTAMFDWEINELTVGTNGVFNMTAYLNSTLEVETLPIQLTMKVTDSNGCEKEKTVAIDNLYCGIQKGISVNEDQKNDYFDLRLLEVKQLKIFNRYGMMVYNKVNYYDEWKGQSDSGQELPDGVYYYVIDLKSETTKTGWIYLNRETK